MLFHSYQFLLVFLPLTLLLYCKSGRGGKTVLLAASLAFAAFSGPLGLLILLGSSLCSFYLAVQLRSRGRSRPLLIAGLFLHIAVLCIFKYANFFAGALGTGQFQVVLPLGISFYTFQQIAYLVDTYRGETAPCSVQEYLLFTAFFPKLVQGPIVSHRDLMPQLQSLTRNRFDGASCARGLYLFAIGLSKKVLVADQFGKIVDFGYGHIPTLNSFEAVLTILAYTFQIYFDFSGYCDMACGVAEMFGLHLPQNFNSPYQAKNISDFWKRWHMTLTGFLTKYIYIPMGGNRRGTAHTCLHIMIVYLVSGLWHGTGVTFLLWGLLHGIATVIYRLGRKPYSKLPGVVQWALTFLFVNAAWVFFRAGSLEEAVGLLRAALFAGGSFTINAELTETLLQPALISVVSQFLPLPAVVTGGTLAALLAVVGLKNSTRKAEQFHPGVWQWISTYVLLMFSVLSISGVSTFLYSNF